MNIQELRKEIGKITADIPLDEQEEGIKSLLDGMAYTCNLLELGSEDPNASYCCFAHALQIHEIPEVLGNWKDVFRLLGSSWRGFSILLEQQVLAWIENEQDKQDGDIVFYFKNLNFPNQTNEIGRGNDMHSLGAHHAGRITGSKIVSKWGQRGNLWEHDIDIVSDMYANEMNEIATLYFRPLTPPKEIAGRLIEFSVHQTPYKPLELIKL